MLEPPRIQKSEFMSHAKEEAQFLNTEICLCQLGISPLAVGCLYQCFKHINCRTLDAVSQQEFLGTGETVHSRNQPQKKTVV